ncbi:MAG: TetR/AcrR family transcriptional regulator [Candidatus Riflebacteria bacterium]|nr:TetR/AcrR family transcriptional regulator [Candidatus Riflebacteria bacterium]
MRQLSESTRESIVSGALRLLATREYDRVTTRDIAGEAGVSEGTVFRYFDRKEAILEAILVDRGRRFFADLDEILDLVDGPYEKVVALCRRHAAFAARNRDLFTVLHRESSLARPVRHAAEIKALLGTIRRILADGVDQGVFRADCDLDVLARSLHGVVLMLLFWEHIEGAPAPTEAEFVAQAGRFHRFYLQSSLVRPSGG